MRIPFFCCCSLPNYIYFFFQNRFDSKWLDEHNVWSSHAREENKTGNSRTTNQNEAWYRCYGKGTSAKRNSQEKLLHNHAFFFLNTDKKRNCKVNCDKKIFFQIPCQYWEVLLLASLCIKLHVIYLVWDKMGRKQKLNLPTSCASIMHTYHITGNTTPLSIMQFFL